MIHCKSSPDYIHYRYVEDTINRSSYLDTLEHAALNLDKENLLINSINNNIARVVSPIPEPFPGVSTAIRSIEIPVTLVGKRKVEDVVSYKSKLSSSDDEPERKKIRQRKVHFGSNSRSSVSVQVIEIPSSIDDFTSKSDLWWCIDDINENKRRIQRDVHSILHDDRQKVQHSIQFLMMSYKPHYTNELRNCINQIVPHCTSYNSNGMESESVCTRGLEQYVEPKLRQYRKLSLRAVLQFQRDLQHKYIEDVSTVAILLRRRSIQLSRSSRQLAFRLAQCDRLHAKQIYSSSSSCAITK